MGITGFDILVNFFHAASPVYRYPVNGSAILSSLYRSIFHMPLYEDA